MTATVPGYDSAGNLSFLCMTSAYDVGRFVVKSLEMPSWPPELSMCGERMSVSSLINTVQASRGTFLSLFVLRPLNLEQVDTSTLPFGRTPKDSNMN